MLTWNDSKPTLRYSQLSQMESIDFPPLCMRPTQISKTEIICLFLKTISKKQLLKNITQKLKNKKQHLSVFNCFQLFCEKIYKILTNIIKITKNK